MSISLPLVTSILAEAGFTVSAASPGLPSAMSFESSTVLGFALEFESIDALLTRWEAEVTRLVEQHQMGLRRSGGKAWNAYALLLTAQEANDAIRPVLNSVEENLVGLRKIVRDGVSNPLVATRALLPLLPFLRSPELPSINMEEEIRLRTGGVPSDALSAFFSGATDGVALQVIEEA